MSNPKLQQGSISAANGGTCYYCRREAHVGMCPNIKSVEYYENGSVKRVEMKT